MSRAKTSNPKVTDLEVRSPYDDELIDTLKLNTAFDAEVMLKKAKKLFDDKEGWLAPYDRIEILKKLASLLDAKVEEFAGFIAKEGGKPLTDARIEANRAVNGIHIAISELSNLRGEEIPMGLTEATSGRRAFTMHEPIGVVVALSAFNHPLNLIVHQVVPAIAAGCPVIVKPASTTPITCIKFVELLKEAGLPDGWCQVCVCDYDVGGMLVMDSRIGFFSFVGSAKVGWMLRNKLSPGVRCALEHGGVAPVILGEDVDIDKILPSLVKGSFYHAGQVCVSIQRIYAPKSTAKEIAQKIANAADKLVVGDPSKEDTDVGPIIIPEELNRVDEWVQEAVKGGAVVITGAEKLDKNMYKPTVLFDPPKDVKASKNELFGPVVCIYPYEDRKEAIKWANGIAYAFQASVFTNDLELAMDTVRRLDASAVMVNDSTAFRADWMPFAGRRASGYGRGGIGYTMKDMMQEKMMVIKGLS